MCTNKKLCEIFMFIIAMKQRLIKKKYLTKFDWNFYNCKCSFSVNYILNLAWGADFFGRIRVVSSMIIKYHNTIGCILWCVPLFECILYLTIQLTLIQ